MGRQTDIFPKSKDILNVIYTVEYRVGWLLLHNYNLECFFHLFISRFAQKEG